DVGGGGGGGGGGREGVGGAGVAEVANNRRAQADDSGPRGDATRDDFATSPGAWAPRPGGGERPALGENRGRLVDRAPGSDHHQASHDPGEGPRAVSPDSHSGTRGIEPLRHDAPPAARARW